MKTFYLLLLLISICSCNTDDVQTTNNVNPMPVSVPTWLLGEWKPALHPNSDVTGIQSDYMHLNFSMFNAPVWAFYTNDVELELLDGDTDLVVHYYDGIDITFRKSDDPESTNIHITYNDNGVVQEFGVFIKQPE